MADIVAQKPLTLLVTRNFPPLVGGMERLNHRLLSTLSTRSDVALCGPGGCSEFAPEKAMVRESAVAPLPIFLVNTFFRALWLACRRKPGWTVAGSGLTAPTAWLAARCSGGKALVYLHGLDIVVPNRIYRWLWLPFIRRCDVVLANSANTARLAQEAGVPTNRLHVLHPGTDLPALNLEAACDFRERNGFGARPLLLSVGRMTRRKGLREFVLNILPMILEERPDTLLVIAGDEAPDALTGSRTGAWAELRVEAEDAGIGHAVCHLGPLSESDLAAAYAASDLHVFPIRDVPGDVEGFGMVAIESAAFGTPTVAFAVGGVADAVDDGVSGALVAPADDRAFASVVLDVLTRHPYDRENVIAFARRFAWPRFSEQLAAILDEAERS